ncbi:MAG: helix-turn-helix transcriptional regulator [Bacilli bacterium]|nr:helix-turn-helix transcriptional regulator [Bacilli bacterium]
MLNLVKIKMTQEELGDAFYVSDKSVSKWERGLSMPDIGIISNLATILDVSVSEILKGEYGESYILNFLVLVLKKL